MIYQDIFCDIKEQLMQTGYFFKFYEYVSMQTINGQPRPMYLIDGGNAIDVMDFDRNGSGYMRKTGPIEVAEADLPTTEACGVRMKFIRLPMRAVMAVPKEKLNNDAYSDDMLALELLGIFDQQHTPPQDVKKLIGRVYRYETDRLKIWREEVGNDTPPLLKLSLVMIDFHLSFIAKPECLKQPCY